MSSKTILWQYDQLINVIVKNRLDVYRWNVIPWYEDITGILTKWALCLAVSMVIRSTYGARFRIYPMGMSLFSNRVRSNQIRTKSSAFHCDFNWIKSSWTGNSLITRAYILLWDDVIHLFLFQIWWKPSSMAIFHPPGLWLAFQYGLPVDAVLASSRSSNTPFMIGCKVLNAVIQQQRRVWAIS